jgi:hypothetical protein
MLDWMRIKPGVSMRALLLIALLLLPVLGCDKTIHEARHPAPPTGELADAK